MPLQLKRSASLWIVSICILLLVLLALSLSWRGERLLYQLYLPETARSQALPLLVVLHGTGGDARSTRQWLGFDALGEGLGFAVVYPHSPDGQWDAGAGIVEAGRRIRRDDVGYIAGIIDLVAAEQALDRIFVVGVSDGAALAVHLSCRREAQFAAVASVAATIPVYAIKDCDAAPPLPALMVHGELDEILPRKGKRYRGLPIYLSLQQSEDWWLARNGCRRQALETTRPGIGVRVYHDCRQHSEVRVYRLADGGHSWPMRDHPAGRSVGPVNRDFDATRVIAEWLMQLKRP